MGDGAARLADPLEVRAQYRDPSRLATRTGLYDRFGTAREPWYAWLYTRLAPAEGAAVLDAGCGVGGVWHANRERLPARLALTLVDRSRAMLRTARERLATARPLSADLRALPLPDESFDLVTANHVLYHVPDPGAALDELVRLVRPGGRLCVATNDWTHLQELHELTGRFGLGAATFAVGRDPASFDLEHASEAMAARFGRIRVERRRDLLRVTEAEPLLDYVRSTAATASVEGEGMEALARHVERQIRLAGALEIVACSGVVVGERPA